MTTHVKSSSNRELWSDLPPPDRERLAEISVKILKTNREVGDLMRNPRTHNQRIAQLKRDVSGLRLLFAKILKSDF